MKYFTLESLVFQPYRKYRSTFDVTLPTALEVFTVYALNSLYSDNYIVFAQLNLYVIYRINNSYNIESFFITFCEDHIHWQAVIDLWSSFDEHGGKFSVLAPFYSQCFHILSFNKVILSITSSYYYSSRPFHLVNNVWTVFKWNYPESTMTKNLNKLTIPWNWIQQSWSTVFPKSYPYVIENPIPGRNNGRNFSGIRALTAVKISHRSRY